MKNFKLLLIYLFTLIVLSGCQKFVEVSLPLSQLTGENVFQNRATVDAAVVDIYSKLRETGWLCAKPGATVSLALYADELIFNGSGDNIEYGNNVLASDGTNAQFWNAGYHQIYCANAVIEGLENSPKLTATDKNQFSGEAKFVRALVHFYFVNIYGDIPYIMSTDYEKNRRVKRMPVDEVYQHIISDLQQAIQLLPEQYISAERARPNRATAWALLARVSLYNGAWQEAEIASGKVIDDKIYTWDNNLENIFLKESTSTIWQFAPKSAGSATLEGSIFTFSSGSIPNQILSSNFINSFEPNDRRKLYWTATVTNGANQWYLPSKYKQSTNTGTSKEYSVIFRLAEQYLIRAEARARLGKLTEAKEDLNKIRNTAGLLNTNALTADEIISAVLKERRMELFIEYGHRFFDLKRTGKLDEVLSPVKPGWETHDRLWPIPEKELIANPNLAPQNTGY